MLILPRQPLEADVITVVQPALVGRPKRPAILPKFVISE
jgi:hypothetical protein